MHCLVGENGAGKSTLTKILSGAIAPDSGTIVLDGTEHRGLTPRQAIELGVATVYQEPELIESLKLLLAAGGDVNLQDKQGRSPLHGAAFWGYNDIVEFLAANHAQLDAKDAKGLTALEYAQGKAGGQGRGGQGVTVNQATARLLEELMGSKVTAQR